MVTNSVLVSLDIMESNVMFVMMVTFSHHLVVNASYVCYNDHVSTGRYVTQPVACGDCVDKLVILHNESMQNVATLQNRSTVFNYDLFNIYQQLNNVSLQAISLLVRSITCYSKYFISCLITGYD